MSCTRDRSGYCPPEYTNASVGIGVVAVSYDLFVAILSRREAHGDRTYSRSFGPTQMPWVGDSSVVGPYDQNCGDAQNELHTGL
ncbi:unnamed protein product [Macrosiphum euphorbiae]|uniref:Uncharacterized protein n=1 Tax=Macrosiphum euphorbiae TaxID=13131 RepID=A0AAV0XEH2_9HEMI|nr:unnamed protein product [Macrosiphum euphorbiae]